MTTTVSRPTTMALCETLIAPSGHGTVGGVSGPVVVVEPVPPVPEVVVVPATPEVLVVSPPPELVVGAVDVVRFVDVEVEVDVDVEADVEVEVDVDVDVDVDVLVLVDVEVVWPPQSASGRCSPGSAGSLRMKSPACAS